MRRADRRCRQRVLRAAGLRARAAVLSRPRRTASSRASSTPTCSSHERPPLLNGRDLARGRRRRRARSSSSASRRLRARFGTVALHRPLGLQPALFLDHLPRADGGHGARLRRRADDRAVRRADGDRHPRRGSRARRLHRPHASAGGLRPVKLRHHRGLAHRAAAVDPAGRHARVGQDDRRRAAGLSGRAARQPGRRRRPQARSQPRGPARARRARARDRALRRRPLPRAARPARRRAGGAARGPRQLVSDRAAAAGAGGVGDAGPQGRPRDARAPPAELPARPRRLSCTAADADARAAGEALGVWADSGVARLGVR